MHPVPLPSSPPLLPLSFPLPSSFPLPYPLPRLTHPVSPPDEGGCEIGAQYGGVIGAQFKDAISAADSSRPLTANSEWGQGSADTLTNIMDVMTCSYNYETYTVYHQTHPWKPIMGGESASCTATRGYYGPNNSTSGMVESNAAGCVQNSWASAAVNAWDSGNFDWTGFDYK